MKAHCASGLLGLLFAAFGVIAMGACPDTAPKNIPCPNVMLKFCTDLNNNEPGCKIAKNVSDSPGNFGCTDPGDSPGQRCGSPGYVLAPAPCSTECSCKYTPDTGACTPDAALCQTSYVRPNVQQWCLGSGQ